MSHRSKIESLCCSATHAGDGKAVFLQEKEKKKKDVTMEGYDLFYLFLVTARVATLDLLHL